MWPLNMKKKKTKKKKTKNLAKLKTFDLKSLELTNGSFGLRESRVE